MPDPRRTGVVAFAGLVFLGVPTGMLGVAWPTMRASLDAPLAGLGFLISVMTVAQFFAGAGSGVLRERLGTVAVLLLPVALAAGGLATFALATGWAFTVVGGVLLGAGVGLLDAAVNIEAALRRGVRFMGGLHGAWAIGAAIGPPLVGVALALNGTWRPAYAAAAIAFALLGGAIYLTRHEFTRAPEVAIEPGAGHSLRRAIVVACALMVVYVGLEVGAGQWSYTRFVADGALDDATAGTAVFLYWSSLAAGRMVLAALGDRVSPARLFDLSVTGALAASLGFSTLPPPVAALVALPCLALALSVFVPLLMYLIPRRVGTSDAARAIGYVGAAGTVGGAVFPSAIGVVMQSVSVGALGPCLVVLSVALAALHLAATRAPAAAVAASAR